MLLVNLCFGASALEGDLGDLQNGHSTQDPETIT
jgi:hypothetical protein